MKSKREIVNQVRQFFDTYNKLFVFGSAVVIAFILYVDAPLSAAIALFTAVYAFIAFNQMRRSESSRSHSPTVRREFNSRSESANYDFGLRNFGRGPALYLRVHATVEPDGPEFTLEESDPPLHLEEDDFVSLLQGDLEDLRDPHSDLYKNDEARRIELYYTFSSISGRQTPPDIHEPIELDTAELVEKAEGPRTESLTDLRKNCAKYSDVF